MKLAHTPIQPFQFLEHSLWIKRDDLLHPHFSGNKARKFSALLAAKSSLYTRLIGYGSPQANSLLSMAALANMKGWQLEFYVDHIASHLQQHPRGNYAHALALGAKIIAMDTLATQLNCHDYIEQVRMVADDAQQCVFVPEGGRCQLAYQGVAQLADEVINWQRITAQATTVFLPSGTGTTAFFLHRRFLERGVDIEVVTCAAVGGCSYLQMQFKQLGAASFGMPHIIELPKKFHFGKPYLECYRLWQAVKQSSNMDFELLYDPIGFMALQQWLAKPRLRQIVYLHQGGLIGNESMLPRYQRKFGL
ncbi:pyridoxal-phosphate dependent enzyme [Shewanella sp. NIFS-20-20]|nr:pyridoxal-phosphate dependent enzyme [Shewanella sp. NIFS-20-20]MBV7314320.1 pyridoxal-phosphate dependent enzyme [Shewanella sp. NIFS-20-20]